MAFTAMAFTTMAMAAAASVSRVVRAPRPLLSWTRLWHWWGWLLYLPALSVLLLYFWGFLDHAWSVVRFPYQIDYGEMPELNRAWLLSQGHQIYVDWSQPPYQMANYTPLYSVVAAAGVALYGAQFFTGRLLSLISALVSGACVASIAGALGAGGRGALVGGLLYFAAYPVWSWAALQRVDSFAVGLELLGVAVFTWGWVPARRRAAGALWATIPLFLGAAYARQTVAAGAFACYGYLLFRSPRLAMAVLATYAAAGLAIFGLLQLATEGQFWRHVVDANVNRWSWQTVEFYWRPFWRLLHWSFVFAAIAALAGATTRQYQIPALYLLASAATALTIGKIGSNVNYLLQLWAALALMTALGMSEADRLFGRLARRRWYWRLGSVAPALWLLVGLQQAFHVPFTPAENGLRLGGHAAVWERLRFERLPLWRLDPWAAPVDELETYARQHYLPNPSAVEREPARQAHEYIAGLSGDVLGEEMSFTVTTGKRIYLQPFEFTQLAEQGDWDQRPLLEDIRQRRFVAVVLRFRIGTDPAWRRQRINQSMIDALAETYQFAVAYDDYFIYRPNTGPGKPPVISP